MSKKFLIILIIILVIAGVFVFFNKDRDFDVEEVMIDREEKMQ